MPGLSLMGIALTTATLALASRCWGGAEAFSGKIYAAGSGQDMMSLPETVSEIMELSGRPSPTVLYLGTATYDEAGAEHTQTKSFIAAGCNVTSLPVAVTSPSEGEMKAAFAAADIVLVSGGNTLFAVDRWEKLGIPALLNDALARGAVLCGGSAGGIVWFDGGSYKNPPGPLLNPNMSEAEMSAWAYIRVPGTGILPGLFCPHYDVTESNGVLRSEDFTGMLLRHSGEYGVAVDNWGALAIDGDNYHVISRADMPGSVAPNGTWVANNTQGRPGAWKVSINRTSGALVRELVPATGLVADLFHEASFTSPVTMLAVARAQNPDDGRPPSQGVGRFASARRRYN